MPLVRTHELSPGNHDLQTYCGLDTMITLEVFEAIQTLTNEDPPTYNFERALQGPILEIMLRGFRVDHYERQKACVELQQRLNALDTILQRYAYAIWDKGLNPRSPKQLIDFFYSAMHLPEQWISQKGERKLSTNREALEKLEVYFHARPIVAVILAMRDTAKKLDVLTTEIDSDGRMRTSYNIAGTETGRFSSSSSATGTGSNLQNITPELRKIFIADQGWKLCVIDLEQAESREVGFQCGVLFDDWTYLDACEGGDLHTLTCKLIWPDLPWPGDKVGDRKLADEPFYRQFSRRDMSKRGGHGSNYLGTPFTMSRHLKVPIKLMDDFQLSYFSAFPAIPRWHRYIAEQIQTMRPLTTPFGRTRHFFGRPNDATTLREAIAFVPQSSTADRTNLWLYRLWETMGKDIQLLAQTHDSVTFQYRVDQEAEVISQALALLDIPLWHKGRKFLVPGEAKIGWNWGNFNPKTQANPQGLMKWKGQDPRERASVRQRIL